MNISVMGSGYVGLVVAACLAETGHHVIAVDIDEKRIALLRTGRAPIYEPGLEDLIRRNLRLRRLRFGTDAGEAVRHARVIFLAVGTPPHEDGSADLEQVLGVARIVGEHLNEEKVILTKSTVPVGTAARVRREIAARARHPFHVCSNPEFLKEGNAVADFMRPDRVVCGIESDAAIPVLEELFGPFVRSGSPLIFMDIASAELTKYASNAMLATRISFMNQMAALCERTGADVTQVRRGIGSDPRIGRAFLFAGMGYGGSCFPKDVRALLRTGQELGVDLPILRAVHEVNERQRSVVLEKILDRFGSDLGGRRMAIWGLAFKAETDDLREAPSLSVIAGLLGAQARVIVHDPVAMEAAQAGPLGDSVEYAEDEIAACEGADALIVLTEWLSYRRPDWGLVARTLKTSIVFDGRNLFEPETMRSHGFEYYPIGRRQVGPAQRERESVVVEGESEEVRLAVGGHPSQPAARKTPE